MSDTSVIALSAGEIPPVPETPTVNLAPSDTATPAGGHSADPYSDSSGWSLADPDVNGARAPPLDDREYWHGLIDERAAAAFLDLAVRTLQTFRYRGGGAIYVAVSSRCIRYRRIDLKTWADGRLRSSTADTGEGDAE